MRTKSMLLTAFLALATIAYGQTTLSVNIPFAFTAGGKLLPAGQYEITTSAEDPIVRVFSTAKKTEAFAKVLTRLAAAMHTTPQDAHLIFDKIGENYTLSEVWLPDTDGYLLSATNQKHEHRVINIPRK
jgi:hypothetical protein